MLRYILKSAQWSFIAMCGGILALLPFALVGLVIAWVT